jgi:hypothetical protein
MPNNRLHGIAVLESPEDIVRRQHSSEVPERSIALDEVSERAKVVEVGVGLGDQRQEENSEIGQEITRRPSVRFVRTGFDLQVVNVSRYGGHQRLGIDGTMRE